MALYGIDAPEAARKGKRGQPYGEEAQKELKRLILGLSVVVLSTGRDKYKRSVCIIKKGDLDVNPAMIKKGYAWAYREYLKGQYVSEYVEAVTY